MAVILKKDSAGIAYLEETDVLVPFYSVNMIVQFKIQGKDKLAEGTIVSIETRQDHEMGLISYEIFCDDLNELILVDEDEIEFFYPLQTEVLDIKTVKVE